VRLVDPKTVAVIVPTLNEAPRIAALLASLSGEGFQECIVVDGGSVDATRDIAERAPGVVAIASARGRGVQLNAGAQRATSDILLFLHADTQLPERAGSMIRSALDDMSVVGGCFRLSFDELHPLLSVYAWASRFETGFTTFGDQAFFVRATAFRLCGGFPNWPFLEDVELRRRLKKLGRFVKLKSAVTTSARRFVAEGLVKRQALNAAILALHNAGVSASTLARWYQPSKH
jgi:rSAM/selenodomain-associated transferase 2